MGSAMLILPPHIAEKRRKQQRAQQIAAQIAYDVAKVYPEHPFNFEVDYEKGYVFVDHMLLSGNKARYFAKDCTDTDQIVKFCGELLERVGIPRAALESFDQIDEAMAKANDAFKAA
jgi:hypothetical protein